MPLNFQTNRSLSEFSTLGVGGPIHTFVEVSTIDDMCEAFSLNLPKMVIGKGSNCLFPDEGYSGLVILNKIDFCQWGKTQVTAGSGYSFSRLGSQSAKRGLTGLEFAAGIPASVGGAAFMNAGANGSETASAIHSVHYFDGVKKRVFDKRDLEFGYRCSSFQKMQGVILSVTFSLKLGDQAREAQLKIINYRKKTQPLNQRSAGCIFRNPPQNSAGALIESCGLKGLRVGGASVSEKHANFIINDQNASSKEVKELIRLVQEIVLEQTGILLEPEVRMINEP